MQATAAPVLPQSTLLLMATACGLCAGANYFNQPLLHSIAMDLGISEARASLTVTMAQVSYALGLLLLVPLGDMLERRRLVLGLMLLAALGMLASGMAHSFALLAAGTLMTGLFSVAAQVLVPMAASFAAPGASGRAVGLVMSGLLIGILASRSVAGVLSDLGGWNAVYWVGALATAGVALLLRRALPLAQPAQRIGYGAVMRSLLTLAREQPRLRSRALIGGMGFATVSVLFSTMALLLAGPGYGFGDAQIGLIGLVGVAGALMANMAGRLADRGWSSAPRWPAACSCWRAGGAVAGRHQPVVVPGGAAHRRCCAAGPAHQQPERDLRAGAFGAIAHQCGLHDGVLHRRLAGLGRGLDGVAALGMDGCQRCRPGPEPVHAGRGRLGQKPGAPGQGTGVGHRTNLRHGGAGMHRKRATFRAAHGSARTNPMRQRTSRAQPPLHRIGTLNA